MDDSTPQSVQAGNKKIKHSSQEWIKLKKQVLKCPTTPLCTTHVQRQLTPDEL